MYSALTCNIFVQGNDSAGSLYLKFLGSNFQLCFSSFIGCDRREAVPTPYERVKDLPLCSQTYIKR